MTERKWFKLWSVHCANARGRLKRRFARRSDDGGYIRQRLKARKAIRNLSSIHGRGENPPRA